MSKKQKISVGVVKLDPVQAMRKASRDQFGHLATKCVPDKATHYSRKAKHRRDFRNERDAPVVLILKVLKHEFYSRISTDFPRIIWINL